MLVKEVFISSGPFVNNHHLSNCENHFSLRIVLAHFNAFLVNCLRLHSKSVNQWKRCIWEGVVFGKVRLVVVWSWAFDWADIGLYIVTVLLVVNGVFNMNLVNFVNCVFCNFGLIGVHVFVLGQLPLHDTFIFLSNSDKKFVLCGKTGIANFPWMGYIPIEGLFRSWDWESEHFDSTKNIASHDDLPHLWPAHDINIPIICRFMPDSLSVPGVFCSKGAPFFILIQIGSLGLHLAGGVIDCVVKQNLIPRIVNQQSFAI